MCLVGPRKRQYGSVSLRKLGINTGFRLFLRCLFISHIPDFKKKSTSNKGNTGKEAWMVNLPQIL